MAYKTPPQVQRSCPFTYICTSTDISFNFAGSSSWASSTKARAIPSSRSASRQSSTRKKLWTKNSSTTGRWRRDSTIPAQADEISSSPSLSRSQIPMEWIFVHSTDFFKRCVFAPERTDRFPMLRFYPVGFSHIGYIPLLFDVSRLIVWETCQSGELLWLYMCHSFKIHSGTWQIL